jgi:hypothetical protein
MPSVSGFRPTSKIKNGKNGLSNTPRTKTHVAIEGQGLANGMTVNVYCPLNSQTPLWTGSLTGTGGPPQQMKSHVILSYVGPAAPGPRNVQDDDTTVGVTVGESSPQQPFNVQVGPILDGGYNVQCNRTGGGKKWLNPNGTTGVNLVNSNPQIWLFTLLPNDPGNCYRIQIEIGNVVYFLAWSNDGNSGSSVSLVATDNGQTTWQIDNNCIKAFPGATVPICQFLSGDTSTGDVTMVADIDPSESTSWSLGTFGVPLWNL